jgi:hypothetical protein
MEEANYRFSLRASCQGSLESLTSNPAAHAREQLDSLGERRMRWEDAVQQRPVKAPPSASQPRTE